MTIVPTPGALSTAIVPPIASVSSLQITRPRPVPSRRSPAWVNGLNSAAVSSMPTPWSVTVNVTPARASIYDAAAVGELDRRCRAGCRGPAAAGSRRSRRRARGTARRSTVSVKPLAVRPGGAGRRARGRARRRRPARARCPGARPRSSRSRARRRSGRAGAGGAQGDLGQVALLGGERRRGLSTSSVPETATSGVRSSWLIVARKRDLARSALSAASRACGELRLERLAFGDVGDVAVELAARGERAAPPSRRSRRRRRARGTRGARRRRSRAAASMPSSQAPRSSGRPRGRTSGSPGARRRG